MALSKIITGSLADSAITTNKIANLGIHSVDISADAITADKIGAGAVTSAKLNDNIALPGTDAVTVPKGTEAQRGAGVAGKFRFNTETNGFEGYNGTAWGEVGGGGGATGGGDDAIFYENGKTITTSYSITANSNAMSAGPITINSGASVTIPDGSRWVVI